MNLSESNLQLKHRPSYTKIVNDRYEGEFSTCTGNLSQDNNAPNEKQPTMDNHGLIPIPLLFECATSGYSFHDMPQPIKPPYRLTSCISRLCVMRQVGFT